MVVKYAVSSVMFCKKKEKKKVAAMGLGLDPRLCPVGKDYPLISRQQSHIMLCSDSVKIEWVSLKLI